MNVDLALEWAALGHRVLPVNGVSKRPLIKAWQDNCTTDETQIRAWWVQYPDARVGIATGEDGFDVLDFDVSGGKPGLAQLEKLLDEGVLEPGTFMVVATPSGGRHLYFRGSEQRNKQNDKAIPGVDFRGSGGMVLAAGNPGYRWIKQTDPADLKPIDWQAIEACLVAPGPEPPAHVVALQQRLAEPGPRPTPVVPMVKQALGGKLKNPIRGGDFNNAAGEESPLDWYVNNHRFRDVLSADGWLYAYTHDGRDYWVRPGKKKADGASANVMVNRDGRETLMNFSTTVDWLPTDRGLSIAQYMAYRDHGGDLKAAARQIRTAMMPRRQTAPAGHPAPSPANAPVAPGMPIPPEPAGATRGAELVPSGEAGTPAPIRDFWQRRPELREVWWRAQVGGVSPWAVLGGILANVAARVGPHVALPPLGGVGAPTSLNLLIAISGNSGTGKGRSGQIAREFVGKPYPPQRKPGTGQGIAAMFTVQTKEGPVQENDTVLLNVAEITQLGAHMGQQGATITSTLLEVYMAEELGEHYANKELRRPVREGAYRLALVAGVQPDNSHILFDHAASGLPQRFVWLPAFWADSVLPEGPIRPPAPGSEPRRWRVDGRLVPASLDEEIEAAWSPTDAVDKQPGKKAKEPEAVPVPVKETMMVVYAPSVRREIETDHNRRLNALKKRMLAGEDDPGDPDSHLLLTRAKVATLLAIWLDGTWYVSEEMWELAGWVIWVSNDTRARAHARLRSKAQERNASRAIAQAEVKAIVEADQERKHNALAIKVMDRVLAIIAKRPGDWSTTREITLGLASRDKKAMREAGIELADLLGDLEAAGKLESMPAEGPGGKGERYRARN